MCKSSIWAAVTLPGHHCFASTASDEPLTDNNMNWRISAEFPCLSSLLVSQQQVFHGSSLDLVLAGVQAAAHLQRDFLRSTRSHCTPQAGSSKPLCNPLAVSEEQSERSRRPDPQASAPTRSQPHVRSVIPGPSTMSSSDHGSMQNGVGEQQYERVPREGLQLAEVNGVDTTSVSSFEKLQPPRRTSRRTHSRYAKRPTKLVAESCQVKMGAPFTAPLHPPSQRQCMCSPCQHAACSHSSLKGHKKEGSARAVEVIAHVDRTCRDVGGLPGPRTAQRQQPTCCHGLLNACQAESCTPSWRLHELPP